ncbi:hypothetical protein JTM05_40840, partial [Pseudomonas aeruginosa]|nr:hypothetical protein [Pseudomonas aeruginosa]
MLANIASIKIPPIDLTYLQWLQQQSDDWLAAQSGVLCQRGIVVDRQMASSLPGISAIGECCEIDGQTWGLVAPCLRQAEVLADRLCGAP